MKKYEILFEKILNELNILSLFIFPIFIDIFSLFIIETKEKEKSFHILFFSVVCLVKLYVYSELQNIDNRKNIKRGLLFFKIKKMKQKHTKEFGFFKNIQRSNSYKSYIQMINHLTSYNVIFFYLLNEVGGGRLMYIGANFSILMLFFIRISIIKILKIKTEMKQIFLVRKKILEEINERYAVIKRSCFYQYYINKLEALYRREHLLQIKTFDTSKTWRRFFYAFMFIFLGLKLTNNKYLFNIPLEKQLKFVFFYIRGVHHFINFSNGVKYHVLRSKDSFFRRKKKCEKKVSLEGDLIIKISDLFHKNWPTSFETIDNYNLSGVFINLKGRVSFCSQDLPVFKNIRKNILFYEKYNEKRYKKVLRITGIDNIMKKKKITDTSKIFIKRDNTFLILTMIARCIYKKAQVYVFNNVFRYLEEKIKRKIFKKCIVKFLKGKKRLIRTSSPLNNERFSLIIKKKKKKSIRNKHIQCLKQQLKNETDPMFNEENNKTIKMEWFDIFIEGRFFEYVFSWWGKNKINIGAFIYLLIDICIVSLFKIQRKKNISHISIFIYLTLFIIRSFFQVYSHFFFSKKGMLFSIKLYNRKLKKNLNKPMYEKRYKLTNKNSSHVTGNNEKELTMRIHRISENGPWFVFLLLCYDQFYMIFPFFLIIFCFLLIPFLTRKIFETFIKKDAKILKNIKRKFMKIFIQSRFFLKKKRKKLFFEKYKKELCCYFIKKKNYYMKGQYLSNLLSMFYFVMHMSFNSFLIFKNQNIHSLFIFNNYISAIYVYTMSWNLICIQHYTHKIFTQEKDFIEERKTDLHLEIQKKKEKSIIFKNVNYFLNGKIIFNNLELKINTNRTIVLFSKKMEMKSFIKLLFGEEKLFSGEIFVNNIHLSNEKKFSYNTIQVLTIHTPHITQTLRDSIDPEGKYTDDVLWSLCDDLGIGKLLKKKKIQTSCFILFEEDCWTSYNRILIYLCFLILYPPNIILVYLNPEFLSKEEQTNIRLFIRRYLSQTLEICLSIFPMDTLQYPYFHFIHKGILAEQGNTSFFINKKGGYLNKRIWKLK